MDRKQLEELIQRLWDQGASIEIMKILEHDKQQREALARVEADLAECSAAHANCIEELRAFHATKPWLVEQQLAEAVELLRGTLSYLPSHRLAAVEAFLAHHAQSGLPNSLSKQR